MHTFTSISSPLTIITALHQNEKFQGLVHGENQIVKIGRNFV